MMEGMKLKRLYHSISFKPHIIRKKSRENMEFTKIVKLNNLRVK